MARFTDEAWERVMRISESTKDVPNESRDLEGRIVFAKLQIQDESGEVILKEQDEAKIVAVSQDGRSVKVTEDGHAIPLSNLAVGLRILNESEVELAPLVHRKCGFTADWRDLNDESQGVEKSSFGLILAVRLGGLETQVQLKANDGTKEIWVPSSLVVVGRPPQAKGRIVRSLGTLAIDKNPKHTRIPAGTLAEVVDESPSEATVVIIPFNFEGNDPEPSDEYEETKLDQRYEVAASHLEYGAFKSSPWKIVGCDRATAAQLASMLMVPTAKYTRERGWEMLDRNTERWMSLPQTADQSEAPIRLRKR